MAVVSYAGDNILPEESKKIQVTHCFILPYGVFSIDIKLSMDL